VRPASSGDGLPDRGQLGAGAGPAAFHETGGERHGVDGAGAGPADAVEGEAVALQEGIEHAPGESAVGAAALQSQVQGLPAAIVWCRRHERSGERHRPIAISERGERRMGSADSAACGCSPARQHP